jgi:hypothetical protein
MNTLEINSILSPIDAAHAASTVSNRYNFISTRSLVDTLAEVGYTPALIKVQNVRKQERQGFQKHIIRFQHQNFPIRVGGDSVPQLILKNSHDGLSSTELSLGLWRLICSNGLATGKNIVRERVTHRAGTIEQVAAAALRLADYVPLLGEQVREFQSRILTDSEVKEFSTQALALRYDIPGEDATYKERYEHETRLFYLNRRRRYEDQGTDLWSVFNRVQENLTKGRPRSGIRVLKAPDRDLEVNRGLWDLAHQFLN